MNYSVTQGANYVALAGMAVIVLKFFGVEVAEEQIVTIIAGLATLAGLITSIINRHSKGDITVLGVKK